MTVSTFVESSSVQYVVLLSDAYVGVPSSIARHHQSSIIDIDESLTYYFPLHLINRALMDRDARSTVASRVARSSGHRASIARSSVITPLVHPRHPHSHRSSHSRSRCGVGRAPPRAAS